MGFLGIGNSDTSNTTNNYDYSAKGQAGEVKGDNSLSLATGHNANINVLDGGVIGQAFDYSKIVNERSNAATIRAFDEASNFRQSTDGFVKDIIGFAKRSMSQSQSATTSALSAVQQAVQPEAESNKRIVTGAFVVTGIVTGLALTALVLKGK